MYRLTINGVVHPVDVPGEMPLLWAIRDVVGLTGTKFGCGVAQCGACTVHLDGAAARSCSVTVADAAGKKITTIEGLAPKEAHPLQRAWVAEDVLQCGYCQPGQIMAAAALLAKTPKPTDTQITDSMTNICRCGCYARIRKAIHTAANGVA